MIIVAGKDKIAPTTPAKLDPIANDIKVITGDKPIDLSKIFGTNTLFSICWIKKANAATAMPVTDDTDSPTAIAGIDAINGPSTGMISKIPAITASGKAKGTPKSRSPT